ncbi:MAG: PKD domain-containing protein [Flavobacteriales bacterium]
MKNNFEDIIRESLNNHEVPYEAGAWEKFQSNLPASTPFYKSKWFIGGVAVLAIIAGTSIFLNTVGDNITSNIVSDLNKKVLASGESSSNKNNETETSTVSSEENTDNEESSSKYIVQIDTTEIKTPNTTDNNNSDPEWIKGPGFATNQPNDKEDKTPASKPSENKKPATNDDKVKSNVETKPKTPEVKIRKIYKNSFNLAKTACEGESINLTPSSYSPNHTYKWIINNGLTSFKGRNITYNPSVTGNTSVKLIVIDENGKELTSVTKTTVVNKKPENAIQINEEENTTYNSFEVTSFNSGNSVYWNMGDGTTSSENTFNHTYKQAGIYTVEYTLTNRNGCHLTETKKIEVKGLYNIRPDYGFSPNGDNINDNFLPEELKTLNVPFEMSIYSRSGQQIYTTKSKDRPWDGNLQDGSRSPFGTYVWVVTLTNEYGVSEVYKGTITNVTN